MSRAMLAMVIATGFTCTADTVTQKAPNPVVLDPSAINFLKAPLAEYSDSLQESRPRGFWVQNWTSSGQVFRWNVSAPKAGRYTIDALISGEPGTQVEIAGPNCASQFRRAMIIGETTGIACVSPGCCSCPQDRLRSPYAVPLPRALQPAN
jgi:hypothetical protein